MSPKLTGRVYATTASPEETVTSATRQLPPRRRRYRKSTKSCETLPLKSTCFVNSAQGTVESIIQRKIKLLSNLKLKRDEIKAMQDLLDIELDQNETRGKHVHEYVNGLCNEREREKYNRFIHDTDNIINLLLSLSGRLCMVENAIKTINFESGKQTMVSLCKKKKKLVEQYNEAKDLKKCTDKRKHEVVKILIQHFSAKQLADFESYIKMKSALIMEQRELHENERLVDMQIKCLRDSIPENDQLLQTSIF